jgi:hypothetical protein
LRHAPGDILRRTPIGLIGKRRRIHGPIIPGQVVKKQVR